MSTLVAQTISNGTVSTSSANVIQGSAKAWVSWNGANGTIRGAYNISSVTRNSTGQYTVNFTNALADANYCISISTSDLGGGGSSSMYAYISDNTAVRTTTSFRFVSLISNGASFFDSQYLNASIFSN